VVRGPLQRPAVVTQDNVDEYEQYAFN